MERLKEIYFPPVKFCRRLGIKNESVSFRKIAYSLYKRDGGVTIDKIKKYIQEHGIKT